MPPSGTRRERGPFGRIWGAPHARVGRTGAGGRAEDIPSILVAPTEDVEEEGDYCPERRGLLVLLSAAVPGVERVECLSVSNKEGRRPHLAFKRSASEDDWGDVSDQESGLRTERWWPD